MNGISLVVTCACAKIVVRRNEKPNAIK